MVTIISGTRELTDYAGFKEKMARVMEFVDINAVMEGGARGTDALAGKWAEEQGLPLQVVNAEWKLFGKRAGIIRNQKMLEMASGNEKEPWQLVAFWDGESRGTGDMVKRAMHSSTCNSITLVHPFTDEITFDYRASLQSLSA